MYAFLFEHLFSVLWVSTQDWNSCVTGQGLFLRHLVEVLGFISFLKEAVQYCTDVKPQVWWLKETHPGQVHHKRPIEMGEIDSKPPQQGSGEAMDHGMEDLSSSLVFAMD